MTQYPTQTLVTGLQARKLGLQLRVTPELFRRQVLHLRCSATILITYEFEAVRVISSGDTSSQSAGSTVQRTREAPVISGARSNYRIGDWISLNCSTRAEDVHLKWYINGDDVSTHLFSLSLFPALTPFSRSICFTPEDEEGCGNSSACLCLCVCLLLLAYLSPQQ